MDQWKRNRGIECLVSKGRVQREREDGNNVCVCVATREEEDRERKVQRCARKVIGSFA